MKKELKEKATKCKDFVKEHKIGVCVGTVCSLAMAVGGVALFKQKKKFDVEYNEAKNAIFKAFEKADQWKPNHCVDFADETTTLGKALEAIEESFKDVDRDTEVFALIYDNV